MFLVWFQVKVLALRAAKVLLPRQLLSLERFWEIQAWAWLSYRRSHSRSDFRQNHENIDTQIGRNHIFPHVHDSCITHIFLIFQDVFFFQSSFEVIRAKLRWLHRFGRVAWVHSWQAKCRRICCCDTGCTARCTYSALQAISYSTMFNPIIAWLVRYFVVRSWYQPHSVSSLLRMLLRLCHARWLMTIQPSIALFFDVHFTFLCPLLLTAATLGTWQPLLPVPGGLCCTLCWCQRASWRHSSDSGRSTQTEISWVGPLLMMTSASSATLCLVGPHCLFQKSKKASWWLDVSW